MAPKSKRLISFDRLKEEKGLPHSRRQLERLGKEKAFPMPLKLGPAPNARIAWLESEIDDRIAAAEARRDRKVSAALRPKR